VVITLINVMGGSSEHRALFPWAAAGDSANHTLPSTYTPEYSYTTIIVIALTGFIALIVYFKNADIHCFYCVAIGCIVGRSIYEILEYKLDRDSDVWLIWII